MKYTIMNYLRISAEDIDLDGFDKYESNSIGNQRALLNDFISRIPEFADCEILEELDDGRTGANFQRPGVQRVIEMAQSGKIQCIIVKDLSRWGRNYIEVGDFLEQKFPAWGVRFISINDMYDSATLHGGTGGIDIAFRNLIYELYSQDLSEKVKSAKMSAAKSGKNCNAEAFYGYIKDPNDNRKLVIDEVAAQTVRRVFELAAQNQTPNQIAKMLNDKGVPTPQERKMQLGCRHRWTSGKASFWYGSVISIFLRDERYTGKLIYGKKRTEELRGRQKNAPKDEWVVIPGAIPAIITEEQFQAVQTNTGKRSKPDNKRPPTVLLFARKLKCGYCGMSMKSIHRADYVKYYCATSRLTDKYGCPDFQINEKDIADAVLIVLQQHINFADKARAALEEKAEKLVPDIDKKRGEVARLKKEIEKSKTAKMTLWERYHAGQLSAEGFQRENEKTDDQVTAHNAKIAELEQEIIALKIETGRENVFVERFSRQAGLLELDRTIIDEFISEIRIYAPDRIEVIFNFADQFEEAQRLLSETNIKRRKAK